jgi:tripartite tricarboxylate transporter TctB family protein
MPKAASLSLSVGVMLLAGYGIFAATGWPWKAALFPLAIGIPLFCLAAVEALWTLFGSAETGRNEMEVGLTTEAGASRRILVAVAWMLGFLAAVVLLGFPIAVPLFLFLYLKLQGGEGWLLSIGITLAVTAVFYGLFDALLHLPFPAGWLFSWLGLA